MTSSPSLDPAQAIAFRVSASVSWGSVSRGWDRKGRRASRWRAESNVSACKLMASTWESPPLRNGRAAGILAHPCSCKIGIYLTLHFTGAEYRASSAGGSLRTHGAGWLGVCGEESEHGCQFSGLPKVLDGGLDTPLGLRQGWRPDTL